MSLRRPAETTSCHVARSTVVMYVHIVLGHAQLDLLATGQSPLLALVLSLIVSNGHCSVVN
jgi:hypothetical protein